MKHLALVSLSLRYSSIYMGSERANERFFCKSIFDPLYYILPSWCAHRGHCYWSFVRTMCGVVTCTWLTLLGPSSTAAPRPTAIIFPCLILDGTSCSGHRSAATWDSCHMLSQCWLQSWLLFCFKPNFLLMHWGRQQMMAQVLSDFSPDCYTRRVNQYMKYLCLSNK